MSTSSGTPIAGGATFMHPARVDDKAPSKHFVRTPGGGWAPRAEKVTPGYNTEIEQQFIVEGKAFPENVQEFECSIM